MKEIANSGASFSPTSSMAMAAPATTNEIPASSPLSSDEIDLVPVTIGVASGANKVGPICAAPRGRHVMAMVFDEATANGALRSIGK